MPLLKLKSIKSKFIFIVLLITLLPLLLGYITLFFKDINSIKENTIKSAISTLDLVCENLVAPLDFDDKAEATRQLKIATRLDFISGIRVYDKNNELFAKYGNEFSLKFNNSKDNVLLNNKIYILRPIKYENKHLGHLIAEIELNSLYAEIRNYIIFSLIIIIIIIGIVVLISLKAQEYFLRPIYFLNSTFSKISQSGDYKLRITKPSSDEFGILYDGVNNMLEQISKRDSEKNKILKELLDSEKYNRTLFETIPIGLAVIDFNGNLIDINHEFSNIFGYSSTEISELNLWVLLNLPTSEQERIIQDLKKFSTIDVTEYPVYAQNGTPKIIRFGTTLTNIGDNEYILAYCEDITQQKEAELAVKKNQDRYEALIKNTSDVILVCDAYGTITYASPSTTTNLGLEIKNVLQTKIHSIINKIISPNNTLDEILSNTNINETQIFQFIFEVENSKPKYFEAICTNLLKNSAVNGYIFNIRDITERILKEIEKQLKTKEQIYQSEARFRVISENVPDVVTIVDLNYNILYITPSAQNLFGISPNRLINSDIKILFEENNLTQFITQFEEVQTNFEHKTSEYKLKKLDKNNLSFTAEITTGLIVDDESARVVVTIRDIEQKKLAEEKLKESEERFRFLAETTGDALYRYRYDTLKYDYLSPAISILTGYTFDELNYIGFENIILEVEYPEQEFPNVFMPELNETNTRLIVQYKIKTKNGDEKWLEDHAFIWKENENIVGTVGILQDITQRKILEQKLKERNTELERTLEELKQMQSQLIVTEKLASIGQLTAGVAHEINNPLGFVSSNLNRFEEYFYDLYDVYKKWAELREILRSIAEFTTAIDNIEKFEKKVDVEYIYNDFSHLMQNSKTGIQRIKSIVESLRGFSYLGSASVSLANINQAIDETIVMVWNELKYKAIIEKDYSEIPEIVCNIGEIKQVFVNLLINASHAIESNGIINIKTYNDNKYIYVEISDNGIGIPEENLHKIFDPFFTTKPVGKGSGLGLWISATIISKHNGEISVKSQKGVGTTFLIKLPINV